MLISWHPLAFLDLGIVDGVLSFEADASINLADVDDPETSANEGTDGKLRLSDFSLGSFKSIIQPSFTYAGSANLPIDGNALVFLPPCVQARWCNTNDPFKQRFPEAVSPSQRSPMALPTCKQPWRASRTSPSRIWSAWFNKSSNSCKAAISMGSIPRFRHQSNSERHSRCVGGLAKAAEELLAGPDLNLLNAKILELETLLNSLGGTPEQNDAVMEQIQAVKSFQIRTMCIN